MSEVEYLDEHLTFVLAAISHREAHSVIAPYCMLSVMIQRCSRFCVFLPYRCSNLRRPVQVARRLSEGWFPILRFDAAVAEPTLMTALVRHRLFAGHRIDTVQADGRMQAEPQVHLFRR